MSHGDRADLLRFTVDLTAHELTRLVAVRQALESDFDELAALQEEQEAYRRLFADLDADQRATLDLLIEHGVLPEGTGKSSHAR